MMSVTTEVASMKDNGELIPMVEENRDPNNLNEHLQVCILCHKYQVLCD